MCAAAEDAGEEVRVDGHSKFSRRNPYSIDNDIFWLKSKMMMCIVEKGELRLERTPEQLFPWGF